MKTTRSNFTRKALTFGIIVFMSVALVASGFAIWTISGGSNASGSSNVNVESVSSANIQININGINGTSLDNAIISFAPDEDDHSGYITYTSEKGSIAEQLSFDVDGSVTNPDKVGELNFSLKVSDGLIYAAGFRYNDTTKTWSYDSSKAYITLPSYAMDSKGNSLPLLGVDKDDNYVIVGNTAPVTLTAEDFADENAPAFTFNPADGTFTATYTFGWGETVGFNNPSHSLDALDKDFVLLDCVTKDGGYSLKQAELVIRLINVIVNGWQIDKNLTYNKTDSILTAGTDSINAYDIDVTNLPETIVGKDQTERLQNLIDALDILETNKKSTNERAQYTVYIEVKPR